MLRDEQVVLQDIQAALQQLGHVEFEGALRRRALVSQLEQLDAELGRVKLVAAQAALVAAKEGANGET